jgi:hypothetical protein
MKRLCIALLLCVMLFLAVPAFGKDGADLPVVVQSVVRNSDFPTKRWILWGYEDGFLIDVDRLNDERIGIDLITPLGFEVRLVYDIETLKVLYSNTLIPDRSEREAMRLKNLSVTDAMKLTKRLKEHRGAGD